MAKRQLSEAAKAAAIIRKELKKRGIKATVQSKTYSTGSTVTVHTTDLPPCTRRAIEQFCSKFQYGRKQDTCTCMPQARRVTVSNIPSKEIAFEIYAYLRGHFTCISRLPENYEDARNIFVEELNGDLSTAVYRVFYGSPDSKFWSQRKPN